jgi:hypothetical protein
MNDDEFSSFVSSGKHHSVSVSEQTGNAKTPQNKVSSNEEEHLLKARSFEKNEVELDLLNLGAPSEDALPQDDISSEPHTDSQRTDALSENLLDDNLQSLQTDNIEDNLQGIASDNLVDKTQGFSSDHLEDNRQGIPTDHLRDNMQGVTQDPMHSNSAGIAKENIEDTTAHIANVNINYNKASISTNPIVDHFEALPSVAEPLRDASIASHAPLPSKPITAKPPLHTPARHPQQKPPTASSSTQAIKVALVQENQSEAFHRRITAIKHNVDELNHKLDDLKDKS